jgi:hypothetical protein
MRTILAILFLCVSLFGQSSPERDKYPITLYVTRATRSSNNGFMTTRIMGYLSDDPQKRQMHMTCDAGIFSLGPDGQPGNPYPARYNKSHEIKIATHDQGSDKIHENTCKY